MTQPTPIVPDDSRIQYDRFHFAPASRVGDVVYVSGVIGMVDGKCPEDPAEQFEAAFSSLAGVLAEAGGGLADIADMTTYHVGLGDHLATFMGVRDRHMSEPWPAWTAIGTTELAMPGGLVEIQVTAHIPES